MSRTQAECARSFLATKLQRLRFARDGAAGVEFAIVAPLLLFAYMGAYELSVGMTVSNKVGRASAAIADMISQKQDSIDTTYLTNMNDVAASMVAPYTFQNYTLKVTGIAVASNKATVAWSRSWSGGKELVPYEKGSEVPLPTEMTTTPTFYIRTELTLPYRVLMYLPSLPGIDDPEQPITLGRTSITRLRKGDSLSCTNCPPAS